MKQHTRNKEEIKKLVMNQNRGKFRRKEKKKMFELMIDGDVGKVIYARTASKKDTGGYLGCCCCFLRYLPVDEMNFCPFQGTCRFSSTYRVAQVPRV